MTATIIDIQFSPFGLDTKKVIDRWEYVQQLVHDLHNHVTAQSGPDMMRTSVMIIADVAFAPKLLSVIGRIGSRAIAKGRDYINKLPSILSHPQLETAGVGAIEAAEAEAFTQAAEELYNARHNALQSSTVTPSSGGSISIIQPIIETAEDAINYMKTIAEDLLPYSPTAMQDFLIECERIRNEIPVGATFATEEFIHYMAKLKVESAIIKKTIGKLRKGYGPIANHTIRMTENHYLGIDINWKKQNPRLTGLHHDHLGTLEKSGIIELINKVEGKLDTYKADVIWNGRFYEKSFFPKHWTRQEVIEKILEAFNDCATKNTSIEFNEHGKAIIEGFTRNGLEIQMIINITGEIITAYPLI